MPPRGEVKCRIYSERSFRRKMTVISCQPRGRQMTTRQCWSRGSGFPLVIGQDWFKLLEDLCILQFSFFARKYANIQTRLVILHRTGCRIGQQNHTAPRHFGPGSDPLLPRVFVTLGKLPDAVSFGHVSFVVGHFSDFGTRIIRNYNQRLSKLETSPQGRKACTKRKIPKSKDSTEKNQIRIKREPLLCLGFLFPPPIL